MTIRKTGKLVPLSQIFGCLTLFLAAWTCVSCEHTPSQQATMQAVREYGRGHQATPAVFSNSSVKQTPVDALEEPEAYQRRLIKLLMTNRFDLLDAEAQKVSVGKDRLVGGGWKIHTFYDVVSGPPRGSNIWPLYMGLLKEWVTKNPQSVAARVALADAYMAQGWEARGGGYSDTVSSGAQYSFEKYAAMAKTTLVDAAKLPEKSPNWYSAMQQVAQAEGWSRDDEKELFDQAIAFEPSYYYFYQNHAGNILPKWYGE